jgi:hypothetical protein
MMGRWLLGGKDAKEKKQSVGTDIFISHAQWICLLYFRDMGLDELICDCLVALKVSSYG